MSQEVPEVRFWGQSIPVSGFSVRASIITPHFHEMHRCSPGASSFSGYLHYELHRRLVDSSSVASVGSAAARCCAGPHERVGVTAKCQEKCAFSTTEDHLPWWYGTQRDAGAPVTGTYRSILSAVKRIRLGQSLTVKQFQRLLGLMAAASNDTFWTAVHETSTVVAQDQRVFPEGQPISHD